VTAHSRYITSILTTFSTFLENFEVSELDAAQIYTKTELKLAAQELLVEFLDWKQEFETWQLEKVQQFLETRRIAPEGMTAVQNAAAPLLLNFVRDYPPFQTEVFLHEFLLALKKDDCSKSTIKNYRSDISQFIEFADENKISALLTKPKLDDFYRYQKEKGLKRSTIKRKFSSIVQFGLWLKQEGILSVEEAEWLKPGYVYEPEATAAHLQQSGTAGLKSDLRTEHDQTTETRPADSHSPSQPAAKHKNLLSLNIPKDHEPSAQANQEQRARLKGDLSQLSNKVQTQFSNIAEQVKQTAQQNILPYVNLAIILVFFLGLGSLGYKQLITNAPYVAGYPTSPTAPGRTLSFQGRLTDENQNPIATVTDMQFILYDALTGGTAVWTSNTCSIDPDQDGIFSVGLGDSGTSDPNECGPAIGSNVFSENPNLFLEVVVGTSPNAETLTPRQPIRTVGYAANAETLQGYPPAPTGGATANTILTMNNDGTVLLGQTNPKIESSSGTFYLEGQAITLQTASASNGNINLAPDGTGVINLQAADVFINQYLKHFGDSDTFVQFADSEDAVNVAAGGVTMVSLLEDDIQDILSLGDTAGTGDVDLNINSGQLFVQGSDGNVGIGTTGPQAKLQVNDGEFWLFNDTSNPRFILGDNPTSGQYGYMQWDSTNDYFRIETTGSNGLKINDNNVAIGNIFPSDPLIVGSSATPLMTVKSGGNVGIGTTTPSYKLEVDGNLGIANSNDLYSYGTQTLGNRLYTYNHYVTDSLTFTANVDELDQALYDVATGAGGLWLDGAPSDYIYPNSLYSSNIYLDTGVLGVGYDPSSVGAGTRAVFSGNVGIGLTSPGAKLQLNTGAIATIGQIIQPYSSVGTASFTGTGLNDLTSGGTFTGSSALNYKIEIDATGTPDTFKWSDDGGTTWDATGVAITGSAQTLNHGVTVTFGATTGHTLGDYWTFSTTIQTADLVQWQNPAGTSIGGINYNEAGLAFNSNDLFIEKASGNVGVGTTNPGAQLNIAGNSTSATMLQIVGGTDTVSQNAAILLRNENTNNDWGIETDVTNSDAFNIKFEGSEYLTINSSGNVGIGTTGPGVNTHIFGGSSGATITPNTQLAIENNGATAVGIFSPGNANSTIYLGNSSDNDYGILRQYGPSHSTRAGDFSLVVAGSEALTIDSSNNVGIGTTTPSYKLEVNGNIGIANSNDLYTYGTQTLGNRLYTYNHYVTDSLTFTANIDELDQAVYDVATGAGGLWLDGAPSDYIYPNSLYSSNIYLDTGVLGVGYDPSSVGAGARAVFSGNVGIGTTSPTGQLDVGEYIDPWFYQDGSSTIDGHHVSLNKTLTNISGDSDLANVVVGTIAGSNDISTDALMGISNSINTDKNATNNIPLVIGIKNEMFHVSSQSLNTGYASYNLSVAESGSGSVDTLFGSINNAYFKNDTNSINTYLAGAKNNAYIYNNTLTVPQAYGTYSEILMSGTTTLTNGAINFSQADLDAGSITNLYFYQADVDGTATTVTNAYGLHIDDLPGTNSWGIYQTGADDLNYFAGNVGVGTTGPAGKLNVHSSGDVISTTSWDLVYSTDSSGGATPSGGGLGIKFLHDADGNPYYVGIRSVTESQYSEDMGIAFDVGGNVVSEAMRIKSNGNVGIGVTDPDAQLEINGQIKITGGSPSNNYVLTSDANGLATWTDPSLLPSDSDWTISGNDMYSGVSGNVGIGTTSPGSKLDVVGGDIRTDANLFASAAYLGYPSTTSPNTLHGQAQILNTGNILHFTGYSSNVTIDLATGDLNGYAWSEDLGWIDFGSTDNPQGPVNVNTSTGAVTGKAYVLNTGAYLDFTNYSSNVVLDWTELTFSGYVWSEDLGWVDFADPGVTISDLAVLATYDTNQSLMISPNGTGDIYFHSTDYYLNSSGNLAIGSNLTFAESGLAQISTSGDGDLALMTGAGNVGIGTSTPSYKLDVNGTGRFSGLLTTSGISNTGALTTAGGAVSINASSNFAVDIATGTSLGAVSIGGGSNTVEVNSSSWNVTTAGAASGLTGISSSGNIDFASLSAGGMVKAAATSGRLEIATAGTDYEVPLTFESGLTRTSNTIRLGGTLTQTTDIPLAGYDFTLSGATGNVGIGLTNPAYRLEVDGAIAIANSNDLYSYGSQTLGDRLYSMNHYVTDSLTFTANIDELDQALYEIEIGNGGLWLDGAPSDYIYPNSLYSSNIYLDTGVLGVGYDPSNVGVGTSAVFSGNVGVGTTSPAVKLEISGGQTYITSDIEDQFRIRRSSNNNDQLNLAYVSSGNYGKIQAITQGTSARPLALNPSGGNVGIGTTSPSSDLEINQTTANSGIWIGSSSTAANLTFKDYSDGDEFSWDFNRGGDKLNLEINNVDTHTFLQNGNVGIGNLTPDATLDVNGEAIINTAATDMLNLTGADGNSDGIALSSKTALSGGNGTWLRLNNAGEFTSGVYTPGDMAVNGNLGVGTTSMDVELNIGTPTAQINLGSGINAGPHGLNFYDSDGTVGLSLYYRTGPEKLYLENSAGTELVAFEKGGNVGIGTTGPQAPLHVIAKSTANDAMLQEWSYADGLKDVYSLMLKQTVTSGVVRYNFSMVNNSTSYDDVLVLDRGNVGIGTTSPGSKLEVTGHIELTNQSYDLWWDNTSDSNYDLHLQNAYDYDGWFRVTDGGGVTRFAVGRNNQAYIGGVGGAGYMVWHAGNDGSGSGLNADLLDGYDWGTVPDSTDHWVNETGDTMTGSLRINDADSIFFEDNKHAITYNDGSGNFNIRIGHTEQGSGEIITETTYPSHMEWSQTSGWWQVNFDNSPGGVGTAPTWNETLQFTKGGVLSTTGELQVNGTGDSYIQGNVGIGTASPGEKLDVEGNAEINGEIKGITKLSFDAGTNYSIDTNSSGLLFDGGDGALDFLIYDNMIYSDQLKLGYSGGALITTYDSGEDLQLTSNGGDIYLNDNVGIGTASPSVALDVSGTIKASGNGTFNGGALHVTRSGIVYDRRYNYQTQSSNSSTLFETDYYADNSSGTNQRILLKRTWLHDSTLNGETYSQYWYFRHTGSVDHKFTFASSGWGAASGGWTTLSPYLSFNYVENGKSKKDYPLGTVVSLSDESRWAVTKSNQQNKEQIYGVVVVPEGFISIPKELKNEMFGDEGDGLEHLKQREDLVPVAHLGEASTIISTINGPINYSDKIIASGLLNTGVKAKKAGRILGTALDSTEHWSDNTCPVVDSIDSINWPEDDGSNPSEPCYRVPVSSLENKDYIKTEYNLNESDYIYIGKIMVFVNVSYYDPDLYLTATGNVGVGELDATNSGELDLAALENLEIEVTDATTGQVVDRLTNLAAAAIGKLQAGLVKTSGLIADNAVVGKAKIEDLTATTLSSTTAKIANLTAETLNSTTAKITDLTATTLQSTKATIDDLTTKKIQIGNFTLTNGSQSNKLEIKDQQGDLIATIDQDGNTKISGNLIVGPTPNSELLATEKTTELGKLAAGEINADTVNTETLNATGSTQLAQVMADSVNTASLAAETIETNTIAAADTQTGNLTATGSTQLAALMAQDVAADSVNTKTVTANSVETATATADNLEVNDELRATNSRLEYLESRLAEVEEIRANTADIVNAQFQDATVSGTLYATNIADFEQRVAEAFRQPSLLGTLLGNSDIGSTVDVIEAVDSAGYDTLAASNLRQSLADLNLAVDDVVISPTAAYINSYLEVNGSGYIADALGVGNYLLVGDGMKIGTNTISYIAADPTQESTLYLQPEGRGRINLMAGLMVLDETGTVTINGDVAIAGNVGIDGDMNLKGKLKSNTMLTNLIEADNYQQPTRIKIAGVSEETGEVEQSSLEIVDETGSPVATISATGRAEFNDGVGVGNEDLTTIQDATTSAEITAEKPSGKAKIKAGTQELIINSPKIDYDTQVFVTPLGSTNNQVLYVKSQTPDNPNTEDVNEGQFVVGFDRAVRDDVEFNWWLVN
jgi:hypothetical protein